MAYSGVEYTYARPKVYPATIMTAPKETASEDESTGFLLNRRCDISDTATACNPCVTSDTNIGAG